MGALVSLLIVIGTTILQNLLTPKSKQDSVRPSGLGEFQAPTVDEGRAVTAWWGLIHHKGPNAVWYGDLFVSPIKKEISGGFFGPKHAWVGWRYALGLQLAIGWGVADELVEIRFDDRPIISDTHVTITTANNAMSAGVIIFPAFATEDDWATVTIPTGDYSSIHDVCRAWTSALTAATGASMRVVYGRYIAAGYNDTIKFVYRTPAGYRSIEATLNPGAWDSYDPIYFNFEIQRALNAADAAYATAHGVPRGIEFSVGGTTTTPLVITVTKTGLVAVSEFWFALDDAPQYAYPILGVDRGLGTTWAENTSWATPTLVATADVPSRPSRFMFWAGPYFRIAWGITATNCGDFFGAGAWPVYPDAGYYQTIEGDPQAHLDRVFLSPGVITDMGDYWRVEVNAPTLFGGDDRDGGVIGTFDIYKGTDTQTACDYLEGAIGASLPGYRGLVYCVARRPYLGNSEILKQISFVMRRCPNGLALIDGAHVIGRDANAANILYEILTNARWGIALSDDAIDLDSFRAAGQALATEGLGLSLVADTKLTAHDQAREVLRHIDGVMYAEPDTGKLTLKLIRADYDVDDLLVIDESVADEMTMAHREGTSNVVIVRYTDRAANFTERVAQAIDSANVDARGGEVVPEEIEFKGLSNAAAAQLVAARCLETLSSQWDTFRFPANRKTSRLRPAGVFNLSWARLGISRMVCRVRNIELGTQDDPRIMIEAVQDHFGADWTAYAPPVTGWEEPFTDPVAASEVDLVETPYALLGAADRFVSTLAARGEDDSSTGYQIWSDASGGTDYAYTNDTTDFTATAVLAGDVGYTDDTLIVGTVIGESLLATATPGAFASGANILIVGEEWIAWQSITDNGDGTFTLGGCVRGVCDTMPALHTTADRVWFVSTGSGLTALEAYATDVEVHAKLLPFNARGVVNIATATDVSLTTDSRAKRPYAPRDVLLNGDAYPVSIAGELTVDWTHRDRLSTWVYTDGGATAAIEAGCGYRLRLYGDGGTLLKTVTGLTGTSYTWTSEASDSGGELNGTVRVVLDTVATDSTESYQLYDFTVPRTGWGLDFGRLWG